MSADIIPFPTNENLFYVKDGEKIIGCCTDDLLFSNEGGKVNVIASEPVDREDVKELMIMWLALNYPDVLKYDEVDE